MLQASTPYAKFYVLKKKPQLGIRSKTCSNTHVPKHPSENVNSTVEAKTSNQLANNDTH